MMCNREKSDLPAESLRYFVSEYGVFYYEFLDTQKAGAIVKPFFQPNYWADSIETYGLIRRQYGKD